MSEINSRMVSEIAAGRKVEQAQAYGKKRVVIIQTPATYTAVVNDTIGSGVPLPVGTRLGTNHRISFGTGASSSQIMVGLRNFNTKVAIDADGIATGVNIVTAGVSGFSNGALMTGGANYVTDQVSEAYVTWMNADPQANQQWRIEIEVFTPD